MNDINDMRAAPARADVESRVAVVLGDLDKVLNEGAKLRAELRDRLEPVLSVPETKAPDDGPVDVPMRVKTSTACPLVRRILELVEMAEAENRGMRAAIQRLEV